MHAKKKKERKINQYFKGIVCKHFHSHVDLQIRSSRTKHRLSGQLQNDMARR